MNTDKIAAYLRWIMRTVNNFEAKTGKGGWFAEEMQDACNAIAKETGTPAKFGISQHSTEFEHPTGDNPFPGKTPEGWVTWWPRAGGGDSPVYSHGATKPSYGPELNALLRIYPVFTAD